MAGRKSRAKITDDPLVPLSGERLQAAIELRRVGVVSLAKQAGTSQQALSHHAGRAGIGKCRESLRGRLAKALHVSVAYLGGEATSARKWFPLLIDGTEYRYSAMTLLAAETLAGAVEKACLRDCKKAKYGNSKTHLVLESVWAGIANWIEIGPWRPRLLSWTTDDLELHGFTEPPSSGPFDRQRRRPKADPNHERAVLGLIAAIQHVLTPWFDGDVPLRYAAFRDYQTPPQRLPDADAVKRDSDPSKALPSAD